MQGFQNQNKRKFEEELVKHVNSSSNYNNSNSNGKNYNLWGAGTSNVGGEIRAGKQMRISSGDGVGFVSSNNIRNVGEVNQSALKKAFLHFVKVINENEADRKKYLEDRKQGRLQCVACGRFVTFRFYFLLCSLSLSLSLFLVSGLLNIFFILPYKC